MTKLRSLLLAATLPLAGAASAQDFASPADFGVTDFAYKVSETDFNMQRSLAKAPVNEWAHQSDVSRVDTQQVIRENQDVIYSSAVVDVSEGATISVPEGDTYHSIEIIDFQNYIVDVIYSGESITITPGNLTYGDYVYLNMRIRKYAEDQGGLEATLAQQGQAKIEAASARAYETPDIVVEPSVMEEIRAALIADVEAGKLPDTTAAQGSPFDTEPLAHLYATAYGWGGLSVAHAAYLPIDRNETRIENGKSMPSSFTFTPPEIDYDRGGFWSITTYNDEGWIAMDEAAISNSEAEPNADGSYTINFNTPDAPNNVDTPTPFTVLMRVYVPSSTEGIVSYFANEGQSFVIE